MRLFTAIFFITIISSLHAQPKTDAVLKSILSSNNDSLFQNVLSEKDNYRVQIIYTQINRDKNNVPHFKDHFFNVDSLLYFNPASTVKLPLAALSLEKLNDIKQKNINKYTSLQYDSAFPHQTKELFDSTAQTNLPSVAQFIKKAFLISDNDAYNRMYEFVGQQTINENLHNKGYKDVRIIRQFLDLNTTTYYDSYVKFFFQDSTHKIPNYIRVFNKVGWSYGFLIDVSYIVDFKNHIEFMLAATLYVNSDGILNDDKYDYDSTGHPFLNQLGKTIYNYELKRKRSYKPDLSAFKIYYEYRNLNDTRPAIKDADN